MNKHKKQTNFNTKSKSDLDTVLPHHDIVSLNEGFEAQALLLSPRRPWIKLGSLLALIGYISQISCQFLIVSGLWLSQAGSIGAMEKENFPQFSNHNTDYYLTGENNKPWAQKLQGSQKDRMISDRSTKSSQADPVSLKSQQIRSPRVLSSSLKSSKKSYRAPKARLISTTHAKENIFPPFYRDSGHPLTHKFWKKKDLSDRLNHLRDSVERLKADIVESKENPTEFCQPYLETCKSVLTCSKTDLSLLGCEVHLMLEDELPDDFGPKHTPAVIKVGDNKPLDLFVSTSSGAKRIHAPDEIELGSLDTFFQNHYELRRQFLPWNHPIMEYITSRGGHKPSISICDDPATSFSVKNLKGGSGCDLTILSRKGTNIIAIKKFDNLEEGLNELFYSLVVLGMNPSPHKLKMARIYDAIIYPENCLNLVMEGANSGVIHDYLSTDQAEEAIIACANYFARFHVKSYLKRKENIDRTKYIKHAAWSHNTTIGDPFKEGLQEKASLDLLTGQQWISNDIESIKSDNVVRLLPEQDQENFAHLVKGVKDRFEENSKEIFRIEKIYNSKLQVPYFLTTTHGDAHGNNFFYFYAKSLLSHDSKLLDDLIRLVTMIDVGKIVRTSGNIGDPAEDVGRFLGSLWDWFFLQDSENIISRAKIRSLQNRFIESYLIYIKNSRFIAEEEFEKFEKVFLENCEFFKLRFYRAIFNFIKDKDKEKDKKVKLKVLESWMEENGINSAKKQVAIYWSLKEICSQYKISSDSYIFKNCTSFYWWSNNVALRLQNYHKPNTFNNEPIHRHWTKVNGSTRVIHRLLNRPVGFIESSSKKLPKSYLTRLWEELQSTGSAVISSSAVIAGMGGIGKTSLALEYAYEALDNNAYNLIYLIFSETEPSLLKGYRYLLHDLQVPIKDEDDEGIIALIKQKVPNYGKCLLIYDNVPYPGFLDDKAPPNTDILITSRRSQGWGKTPISLEVFRLEDSVKYLLNILDLEENPENRDIAEKLAKTLYNFPLALSHAAHYIKLVGGKSESEIRSTLEKYRKDFEEKPEIHFKEHEDSFKANELEMTYKNLIGKTYSMSSQYITEQAKKLMIYCSYLDPNSIEEDIFLKGLNNKSGFQDAIAQLSSLSLINRIEGESLFSVHRLVQLVVRNEQEAKNRNELTQLILPDICRIFKRIFINNIYSVKNILPSLQSFISVKRTFKLLDYLPHIKSSIDHLKRLHVFSNEADSLQWIGKIIHVIGREAFLTEKSSVLPQNFLKSKPKYGSKDIKLQQLLEKGSDLFEDSISNIVPTWLIDIAEKSHPAFQTILGTLYGNSLFVDKDTDQAILWFTKAAVLGFPVAMTHLGKMYENGEGVDKNFDEAFKWYTKAAELGCPPAQTFLGHMYEKGEGVLQNFDEAYKWYTKAAEQGDVNALYNLAWLHVKGFWVDSKYIENAPAQCRIGEMYADGEGVEQDYTEAFKWYAKAAKQGDPVAQEHIGHMYEKGEGVDQDYAQAYEWYSKAAKQGYPPAQNNLGWMYENGIGVDQNFAKALKWYSKAAKQGHPSAQNNLGRMYAKGQGVDQNFAIAFKWYTKAAEQDDVNAQYNLGYMYENGEEIEQDYNKAFEWYSKAAEQGDAEAQYNLGRMYENGEGIDQNEYCLDLMFRNSLLFLGDSPTLDSINLIKKGQLGLFCEMDKLYCKVFDKDKMEITADKNTDQSSKIGLAPIIFNKILGSVTDRIENVVAFQFGLKMEEESAQSLALHHYTEAYQSLGQPELDALYKFISLSGYSSKNVQKVVPILIEGDSHPNYKEAFKWYFKAAEQEYAEAQNSLGWMYENGYGVDQDDTKAFGWYSKAAKQGNAMAQNNLGRMYENGYEVEQDETKAFGWYSKAAEQDDPDAQNNLGRMYENGYGVERDDTKAFEWYSKAAEQGDAMAQNNLGWMYQNGKGVGQNFVEAFKWYTKSAEQGDAMAQNNLGWMYQNGKGVGQNFAEAFKWFTKASEQEDADAQNNIGEMYRKGQGMPQDYAEAIKWYTRAADQGNVYAQSNFGEMYANGQGVPQSDAEAIKWFAMAADQGDEMAQDWLRFLHADDYERTQSNPEAVKCFTEAMDGDAAAQNKLGEMYAAGQCMDQNDAEAVRWNIKAAEQDNIEALYNLGLMYAQGRGVEQSETKAQRCFTKASAHEGNSQAQYDLGVMCLNGTGIEQSDVEALKWITLAAQQGNTDAQYRLGAMYAEGQGVEQSDDEARNWFTLAANQGHPIAPLMLKGIYNQDSNM